MASEKVAKISDYFVCNLCHYITCKYSDFLKHNSTLKHKKVSNASEMLVNASEKVAKIKKYVCCCGKKYNHDSSYYRHKKMCEKIEKNNGEESNEIKDTSANFDKDLILMILKQNAQLVKENTEFKNMVLDHQSIMLKVIENGTHNITNNNSNNNSNNKTFNLNVFLNETCKDAMNIMDFVESIQLQLSDLENVGRVGYVEGITNIITKNLKALHITQRPIHCTDKKREVLYIKDENKWEKEDDSKKKIRKVIKRVASKNHRLILKFKEAHPDCLKSTSNYSDQYNKIIIESCGGSGDNDMEKEDKIIHNISKTVIVDK